MRRKPRLDSRIMQCEHLLAGEPEVLRGRWLEEFSFNGSQFKELHVELGCGKGSFTVGTARSEPCAFLVGVERITNVLVAALERAEQERVQNIRFLNKLADDLISFFAEDEVSRIYINFCDPWPANRHSKRRLTGQRFLEIYKTVLQPGGEIHFKTDNLPLFDFSLIELEKYGFSLSEVSYNLHEHGPVGIMSDYEKKFYGMGIPINRCVAKVN